jgi:serine/threonine protein phosphatase 1
MSNRRFVIGDIHGQFRLLKKLLKQTKFQRDKDLLIILGDVCDGGPQTKEVINELIRIKNKVLLVGNHDMWALGWMIRNDKPLSWVSQGGSATMKSYMLSGRKDVPQEHIDFLETAMDYYILDNMVFVHGGFDPDKPLSKQLRHTFAWNRDIISYAREKPIPGYDKVFIGHTTTQLINFTTSPVNYHNLWCLDTGGGYDGKLTIMDIDTMEYWQESHERAKNRPL